MSKSAIILINEIKQYIVEDIYKLQLNDIRKFIKKEFNTGEDVIYLYDNNLSKNIYVLNDLLKIKEDDYKHNLCIIKIRFKTRKNIDNNTNNLAKTMILNANQVNKAYYGNEVDLNNRNNNIKMRESNKMIKYKNDFRNSGKNVNYKIYNNINKNNSKQNYQNYQNYKNINTKLSGQIDNSNNNYVNNKNESNKNINNNISNKGNKNVNIYINKANSQNINNNINNNNKINDNNMIKKESYNITETDMNINNISNKNSMNINDISNNSSKKNINGSNKENSIKQSSKKMKKIKLDLKNKQGEELQMKKNLFKEKSGDINDINEDQKIKEELEKYKKEQEKEIENLEKELSDLKKENEKILKEGNNIEDIFFDEKTIENIKKEIINEVSSKLENEFKNQINEGLKKMNEINIKNHEEQINAKFKEIKKEYDERIDKEIKDINSKIEEFKNKNNENNNIIIHNIDNNNPNYPQNRIKTNQTFKREKGQNNNIRENFIEKNSNENINDKINKNYNKYLNANNLNSLNKNIGDGQENVEDEDINLNNSGKHVNSFNKPNVNPYNNRKTDYNNNPNLSNNFKKEEPKALNYNNSRQSQIKNQPFQKKKSQELNLLNILTNIFFTNSQMTEINTRNIEEHHLEKLKNEYIKHLNDEKNIVYIFVNNFIKTNLLRLFKSNRYTKNELEIVKTKISLILQCINMNKDYYSAYYYPQMEKGIRNYHSSVEAARRFRKEFNINEKDINENMLIKYLDENNNDIYQAFGEIYGK